MVKREPDSEQFIRPQRQWADIVVTFYPPQTTPDEGNEHLNVRLVLRPNIPHPDLSKVVSSDTTGYSKAAIRLGLDRDMGKPVDVLEVDGHATEDQVVELEHFICGDLPNLLDFCNREMNPELGKVTGTTGEALQSFPLAITQLLVTYHMLKATQPHQ
jgi:phosphoribulokinase